MSIDDAMKQTSGVKVCANLIELTIADYRGYGLRLSATDYIQTYSDSFLQDVCPEALKLPGAFLLNEGPDETFIGIHLNANVMQTLNSKQSLVDLLRDPSGLNAFLILSEEISHFHHYLQMLEARRSISRFDLELQAELDKIIVISLITKNLFGKTHLQEILSIVFDHSEFHGTITNYQTASKIAEKFWKMSVTNLGPKLIFDSRFRKQFFEASLITGDEKRRLLDKKLRAA